MAREPRRNHGAYRYVLKSGYHYVRKIDLYHQQIRQGHLYLKLTDVEIDIKKKQMRELLSPYSTYLR